MSKQQIQFNISALDLSRIAVIGCPGSGKTTFSNRLGNVLDREIIHLDKLLWGANWQMLPYDERRQIHNDIICSDTWIIDGMWKSHLAERLDRATTVIFLDYKRGVSMRRAIFRRLKYHGKQREDIADGCLEKLDNYFLHYIWTFRKQTRPIILAELAKRDRLRVVTLRNTKQTEKFLESIADHDFTASNTFGKPDLN